MPFRWSPGDLFGRYRIDGVLGRGGMGEVYLAYDAQLRRKVAIKVLLRTGEATDDASRAKLLREARAAAAIEHPNAVQVFDVDEVDGMPFIAMELVEGKPLRAYVGDPSVTLETKVTWLVAIARALHAAHTRGIVHRDVKPENVIIRDDGVVKVLDFGTARRGSVVAEKASDLSPMASTSAQATPPAVASATDQGLEGTLLYMSPEHVRGEPLDGKADQWAWGVVAYELFTGTPPWDTGRGSVAVVSQILSSAPEDLRSRRSDVPSVIADAVTCTLRRPREERFIDMEAVAHALSQSPPEWPPPIAPLKTSKKRASWLLAGAAALVAMGAVAGILRTVKGHSTRLPPAPVVSGAHVGPPDYGSPMSTNPVALAEYRRAVQAARDAASTSLVTDALDRAREADPDFAAAYLRELLMIENMEDVWRTLFADTQRVRDRLGPHDRALLDAIEPRFRVPHDTEEMRRRFAKLAQEGDSDFDLQRCMFLVNADAKEEGRAACLDAQRADPTIAAAYLGEGLSYRRVDSAAEEQAYRRCLEHSPEAGRCVRALAGLAALRGQCDEYVSLTRSLVSASPNDIDAYDLNALAVYAKDFRAGVDFAAFSAAASTAVAHHEPAVRPGLELSFGYAELIGRGRLNEAFHLLDGADASVAKGYEDYLGGIYLGKLQLLIELGRTDAALALSRTWVAERAAWVPSSVEDSRIHPLVAMFVLGALPRDRFIEKRQRWLDDEQRRGATLPVAYRWLDAYAQAVRSEADALEALEALPRFQPMPELAQDPSVDAQLGRVYLVAGRFEDALPLLRAATNACPTTRDPLGEVQNRTLLGRALGLAGDKVAGCECLRAVNKRWGREPTSQTARRARVELGKLGCALGTN